MNRKNLLNMPDKKPQQSKKIKKKPKWICGRCSRPVYVGLCGCWDGSSNTGYGGSDPDNYCGGY